jgi:hypothetical protein
MPDVCSSHRLARKQIGKTENEMDSGAMRPAYATRRSTRDNVRKVIDTLLAEPLLQA